MSRNEDVRILLVEDNPRDVELMMRAFIKHNLANQITHARDGVEALDYLFSSDDSVHLPKVVLLDLKLPRVSGIEVLQRIRGDERTKLLPVVVMTSSQEERDVIEAYQLGVNSYVVKPMDFDQFVRVVAELGYYWVAINKTPL
jgi:two-component system, response regulator